MKDRYILSFFFKKKVMEQDEDLVINLVMEVIS